MKRTNLVLNEDLLKTATQLLGYKTYSAAVNYALETVIKLKKIKQLHEMFGTLKWDGNLSEMREDRCKKK